MINRCMVINELVNPKMSDAAITARVEKFVTELMPYIPALPRPRIVVSNIKSSSLGHDKWSACYENGIIVPNNTTEITIFKRAAHTDDTLRRVIAHELCHHADFLCNEYDKAMQLGWHQYISSNKFRDGHGAPWLAFAAKFNKKFGDCYVTQYSDESDTVEELHAFYVFLFKWPSGKISFQQATKLSNKMRQYIVTRKHADSQFQFKVVKTKNTSFIAGASIGSKNLSTFTDPADKAMLQTLWDTAPDIAPRGIVDK